MWASYMNQVKNLSKVETIIEQNPMEVGIEK